MGISLVLAALIGRAIRSLPHVPLGARPPLRLPRAQVLVPAALGGMFAALSVFALAAPSLDPGLVRPGVTHGSLLPGPPTGPSLAAQGARKRARSAPRSAAASLAGAAVALPAPSTGVVAPAGLGPPAAGPRPGSSGRKRGGGNSGSIPLPANDQPPAPTPPAQPPAVPKPTTPAPAEAPAPTPAPVDTAQVDAGWQKDKASRRPVELPSEDNQTDSAPSVPPGREETGRTGLGGSDGDE
jgi:hypothetical protein